MTFLAHPLFLQFAVPLMTVAFTVFLKVVSRNDKHNIRLKKDDIAVGLEIAVTALILFITESASLAQQLAVSPNLAIPATIDKLSSAPWVILMFVLGIWGVSSIVRWAGWKGDDDLNIGWGIVFPDLFGVLLLLFVVNWIR
ncbi:MAG: hypothetical protein HND47_17765 [Chloroflexi bacterium]|nr:hypothetical protein [Chloroflexota bacterium]